MTEKLSTAVANAQAPSPQTGVVRGLVTSIETSRPVAGVQVFVPSTRLQGGQRGRELFLEGQRLNDMLRFKIPFSTGAHPYEGWSHGNVTCWPLPTVEIANNPNITR